MTTIKVLLADDQQLVRGALAALLALEPDIDVVAEVGRGDEVVAAAREHRPDVALLDVEMPGMDGIAASKALRAAVPSCRVLIVTTFGRPGYLRRAMESGASGFVVKDTPARELADAVRRVRNGLRVVDPSLAAESLATGQSPLTAREADVLKAARARRRHRRGFGVPTGPQRGHGPQPPVVRDRQDRRPYARRSRPPRRGERLAAGRRRLEPAARFLFPILGGDRYADWRRRKTPCSCFAWANPGPSVPPCALTAPRTT